LREIREYIARDSPSRAAAVVERLLARSATLAEPPLLGRPVPEYARSDVRELLEPPYRLINCLMGDRIEVLTVKHDRQRLTDRPQDL
jgi:plasmid stabilization system protein ParE